MIKWEPPTLLPPAPPKPEVRDTRVFLSDPVWDQVAVFLIGNQQRFRDHIVIPRGVTPVQIKTNEEKAVEAAMESCIFKSLMSCVLGEFNYNKLITEFAYTLKEIL